MMFVCMFCGTSSHPFEQNEVCIYSMNKISFDRILRGMPEKFWYVTLPEPHQEVVPETGNLSSNPFLKSHNTFVCDRFHNAFVCFQGYYPEVPACPFDEKFDQFAFASLLTRGEVINAMSKVRAECNKVAAMCLFQAPISKSMRLEEFEQTQSQTSSQVSNHTPH